MPSKDSVGHFQLQRDRKLVVWYATHIQQSGADELRRRIAAHLTSLRSADGRSQSDVSFSVLFIKLINSQLLCDSATGAKAQLRGLKVRCSFLMRSNESLREYFLRAAALHNIAYLVSLRSD